VPSPSLPKDPHQVQAQPSSAANGRFFRESTQLWASSEGQIANLQLYLFGTLFCWLLVPLLLAVWRSLATAAHTWELTDQRLIESEGVFSRRTEVLELYRVKDITVSRPFVQRIFGRGQVLMATTDRSSPVVIINAIKAPMAVASLIRHHVEQCRAVAGVYEIER
jgi:uncharacterized membrane protein YdbT with pleckstrin-like domain